MKRTAPKQRRWGRGVQVGGSMGWAIHQPICETRHKHIHLPEGGWVAPGAQCNYLAVLLTAL